MRGRGSGLPPDAPTPEDGLPLLPEFSALLEDSAEDLYEHAPCGYLSTLPDGRIAKINTTLLGWLGHRRDDLVGRRSFADLLTVGGRLYHETHFAPLLRMQGEVRGVAMELRTADGGRLPVLVTSRVKTGSDGRPLLIRTTIVDATDRRAYEQELLRARREADAERERLLRLVATLQRSLLPPRLPRVAGLESSAHYHIASADRVGGDFYDLFPLSLGRWAFFLGDVAGKGAGAAAVTSLIRYTLRTAATFDADPMKVLASLNTALFQEYELYDRRFCTVIFGVLAPDAGGFTVVLASGGHPAALLLGADGTTGYRPTPGGMLVGVVDDPVFSATAFRLDPGDTLLLYTDGLTEAHTGGSGRYDDDGLLRFAADLAPTTAPAAIAALSDLLAGFGDGLTDDAAILALSAPAPAPASTRGAP